MKHKARSVSSPRTASFCIRTGALALLLASRALAQDSFSPAATPPPSAPPAPEPSQQVLPEVTTTPPPATTNAPKQMKTVVVTGSLIPTADAVPIVPVKIVTAEDIKREGASTLSEVIKRLPQNSGSLDDKFQNGFAPGSSAVSLRGLGAKYTLVLLNGHRVAPYGYGQNISDAFTDLNSLPLDAVERVEILTEGASAIYGSDAIGGVVNVILKKDYDGAEVSARFGQTFRGDMLEQTYSATAGIHDKSKQTSVLVNLDYYHRDPVWLKDRPYSRSADHSAQGGFDFTSDIGPNPGYFYDPADPVNNNAIILPDGTVVSGGAGSGNYFDYNPYITAIPETERGGMYLVAQRKIDDNIDLFLETSYHRTWTRTVQAAVPIQGDGPPNLYGNPYNQEFVVPASNPYNIFGQDVSFRVRLPETGKRTDEITDTSFRLLPGVNLHFDNEWEASADFNYNPNITTTRGQNYLNADAVQAALNSTDPATALNVFGPVSEYAPGLANNPALIESLKFNPRRVGQTELIMAEAKASGPILELPGGKLRIAFGAEGRHETFRDEADDLTTSERQVGTGGTSGRGQRNGAAAYAEISIPIFGSPNSRTGFRSLDIETAARFDHYSDFGDTVNPKVGIKYAPTEDIVLRASYGTGFRAPSLQELDLGRSVSFQTLIDDDPSSPYAGVPHEYRVEHLGNPTLVPETSENVSASIEATPHFVPGLTLTAAWGMITLHNYIDSPSEYDIIQNFPWLVNRGPSGEIYTITNSWSNLPLLQVEYVDMGASYVKPTSWGDFTFSADFSWQYSFKNQPKAGDPINQQAGTYDMPEWRGNGSLFWTYHHLTLGTTVNWVGSFDQLYGPDYGGSYRDVADWVTVDLQASYEFPKEFTVTFGVHNVGDEPPPFSDSEVEGYSFTSHDPIGRAWYLLVSKKF